MEQHDIERIARAALRDLGVTPGSFSVTPVHTTPGLYEVEFGGARTLKVKCGPGTTAQWIRQQVLEQYQGQT